MRTIHMMNDTDVDLLKNGHEFTISTDDGAYITLRYESSKMELRCRICGATTTQSGRKFKDIRALEAHAARAHGPHGKAQKRK